MSDIERRAALRRQQRLATGLLVVAAIIFLITTRAEAGAPAWVGFVRAAAEAAMIGGLADWFAVTALFRHPLGIPIPHTALIPNRKDALGQSLADFVGTNFLSAEVVRDKLERLDIAARVGVWLADDDNARRASREGAALVRGAVGVLSDETVSDVVGSAVRRRLEDADLSPLLGSLLARVVDDGAHVGFVDLSARSIHDWLVAHRDRVIEVVSSQAPTWSPRFIDERIADRVHLELVKFAAAVRDEPEHPMRGSIDDALRRFADDLQHDPTTRERAEATKRRLLAHPDVANALGSLGTSARNYLLEAVDDPTSDLRVRSVDALLGLGKQLRTDPVLAQRVNRWTQDAAAHVVTNVGAEVTTLISDTVQRWDAQETSERIELQVGRDLQFIRINGTVVGALAGLAIHTVAVLIA